MATTWRDVERIIGEAEKRHGCTLGVSLIGPSGTRWGHNESRRFVAASTVKIPIMIELFRQVDAGERALADPYALRAKDKAPGSGVMLHLHEGMIFTVEDLCYLMISISDNTATNLLIDRLGMDRVNATMQDLGLRQSTLGRRMMGRAAKDGEAENWAVPAEYAAAVAALLAGTVASSASCAAMIAMLEKQQNGRRIGRHVAALGTRWGSKTGSLTGITNDVGFIEGDRGVTILSLFCERLPDIHLAERILGEVSLALVEAAWA